MTKSAKARTVSDSSPQAWKVTVVLVLELQARGGEELVHLELLALGQGFWAVTVEGAHVSKQRVGIGETMALADWSLPPGR